jgi:biopolymer transport protein ExbD
VGLARAASHPELIAGGPTPPIPRESISLAIDFDGTILWNGTVIQDLVQLERYFLVSAAKENQPELRVQPNRRASYDTVAKVLAIAQRSGMQRIGFVDE